MIGWQSDDSGDRWVREPWLTHVGAALCLAAVVASALAQRVQQNGRLGEVNTLIGSGGYNYARPASPLIMGNAVMSGNVRGGLAFRGFEPIRSPTAFLGSLPSASLSSFRRDSVSVADVSSPYAGMLGVPFYDPSQTVPMTGFLTGQYGTLSSRAGLSSTGTLGRALSSGATGPLDLRLETGLSAGLGAGSAGLSGQLTDLRSQIVGLTPGATPELASTIFGPTSSTAAWRAPGVADQAYPNLSRLPGWESRGPQRQDWYEGPRLQEVPGSRPPLGTPLELVRSGRLPSLPEEGPDFDLRVGGPVGETPLVLGLLTQEPGAAGSETQRPASAEPLATPSVPTIRDPSVLPGYDVFTDIQLALALSIDPDATWYADMQEVILEDPAMAELLGEVATKQAQEFIAAIASAPITTFAGAGDSGLNNEMLKAESLLEIGEYYEAARCYGVAHHIDPLNPLPLIGRGNALLAAGEYLSAAVALIQGFERYPELSRFTFNLTALLGGGEIVDIRRADLMRRLETQDDPRLRFLLGYLEYYSAPAKDDPLRASGLQHLGKAAELDRGASIISRFPAMLRGEGRLPPPKLPGSPPGGLESQPDVDAAGTSRGQTDE